MVDEVPDSGMPTSILMSPTPVAVVGTIRAKTGREADLKELITAITPLVRHEEGYEEYLFHTHADEPGVFTFYERWSSGADLVRHAQQPFMVQYFSKIPELVEPEFETSYLWPLAV